MSIASEPKRCPRCGGPIPAEAPQGLCPKCLLLQASMPTEAGKGDALKPTPPAREELAAAFPQLEILELIGQGGMGFVFKARQPKLERLVALKILPQSLAADPAFAERFTREGRVLARLNHPNIVIIHDFGQANGFFYLLMEFVDGVNLRQAMKVGRFTPAQALAVVPKICEALQFAHNEGILHRDIKPENILLDSKGRVKIADFGIAKLVGTEAFTRPSDLLSSHPVGEGRGEGALHQANLTETGKTLGTPQYMAPEQLEHPQDVDQRADIYSLGVVFYEMLTGELPIGRFAPPSEKSAVDPRMDEVVLHTLEKERERRTQTAGEVKTQVETIAASGSAAARGTSADAPLNRAGEVRGAPGMTRHLLRGAMAGLLVFFLTVFAASLITFLMPESYEATARIKVGAAAAMAPPGQPFDPYRPGDSFDPYLLQGEFEVIRSEVVLGKVIERLQLRERWADRYGVQPKLSAIEALELLKSRLDIRPVRNTMLLEVGFFSDRPNEAAEVANAIVENYTSYHSQQIRAFEQAREAHAGDSAVLSVPPRPMLVEMIDRAVPPLRPSRPNKPLNIALGIAAGVVLGLFAGLVVGLVSLWKSGRVARQTTTAPTPKPDRFWRWFAVVVLAMIAIPIGIAVLGILAAIAIPNFVKAREHARHQQDFASLQAQAAGIQARTSLSVNDQAAAKPQSGKTVVLSGATNELLSATNDLRVVRVHTDSTLLPGETLVALTRLPDGQMASSTTSFFIQRRGTNVQTSSYFSWSLANALTANEFESAAIQLRKDKTERPLELTAGKPLELFSVTNQSGGVMSGYLKFEHASPETASVSAESGPRVEASIRFRPYGGGLLTFYTATVPPGYFLEATDNSADLGEGQASTSLSEPAGSHSSWSAPRSFTIDQQREGGAQLQRLADQGPVQVWFGEPLQAFALTNKAGEVYRGFFELVGPPRAANQ